MQKKSVLLVIAGFLILLNTGFILAQDDKKAEQAPAGNPADVQWLWGEVTKVDVAGKTLTVKYIDYDTDAEKETNIMADDRTVFENSKSLEDIKPQDTISIDYVIGPDGKNIAKNISVETIENESAPPQEETTAAPEKVGSEPKDQNSEAPEEPAEGNMTVSPEMAK